MKRLLIALLILFIIVPATVVLAAVTYSADITVANNSSTSYSQIGVTASENVTLLVSNGFITSSGLDSRVQQSGSNLPFMLATDRVTFSVPSLINTSNVYQFVTGQTATSSFQIVPGYGGYVTTNDTATLEPSANYSISTNGYIDTASGAGKYIARKENAIAVFVSPTMSGNITVQVNTTNETIRPDGAGDETNIANLAVAPTHWQAVSDSDNASFVYTAVAPYERDLYTIANLAGTSTIYSATIYFSYGTSNAAHPAFIKPAWKIGGVAYDGSEQTTTANQTVGLQIYTTNPQTGVAWTKADIDAAQVGASIHNDTVIPRPC